ncbi:MAG: class I SAM-dependent methyltransferase [Anaerolineae bacterium]|nr:MAG: class I SAM-dependent methyltransferase [Anaerolineae bacterium]
MTPVKSKIGEYWEKHVLSWEAGAYYDDRYLQPPSWWDRLSSLFRRDDMYRRMDAALEVLRPHLRGLRVLDVGCASGRFALRLLEAGAAHVTGVDISAEAIEIANRRRAESETPEKMTFFVADVIHPERPLPQVDLVTALGVIEYFDAPSLLAFLRNLRTRYILFDFPDLARKRDVLTWYLRQVYIKVNRCPGVYLYSRREFRHLAAQAGFEGIWFTRRIKTYFATNLPQP